MLFCASIFVVLISTCGVCLAQGAQPQPGTAPAEQKDAQSHLAMSVVTDAEVVQAGTDFTLAVRCVLAPEWHTYWPGVNDTGVAATLDIALPEGWTLDGPLWPTPHRSVAPGDLLDHVLEGEFSLLYTVHVPVTPGAGGVDSDNTIKVSAEWMVCKNVCVIERSKGETSVRVGGERRESAAGAAAVRDAKKKVPEQRVSAGLTLDVSAKEFTAKWEGATSLAFAPSANGVEYPKLLKQGERKADAIAVTIVPPEAMPAKVEGVLTAMFGVGESRTSRSVAVSVIIPDGQKTPDHGAPTPGEADNVPGNVDKGRK